MPKAKLNWSEVDKSDWPTKTDPELGRRYGVDKSVIAYWRQKANLPTRDEYIRVEREAKFADGLHWCAACQRYHPVSEFGPAKQHPFGLRTECKAARREDRLKNAQVINERKREDYRHRPEIYAERGRIAREKNKDKLLAYLKRRHGKLKATFVELAGGSCQRCGYNEFSAGFDFHHVDRLTKDSSPSKMIGAGNHERAYAELDKCVLLCRNCHSTLHAGFWTADFEKRDGLGWTITKQSFSPAFPKSSQL